MKSTWQVRQLAAADDLAPLVLELVKCLCKEKGLDTTSVLSPTSSTAKSPPPPAIVDKSGVPTTTEVDREEG